MHDELIVSWLAATLLYRLNNWHQLIWIWLIWAQALGTSKTSGNILFYHYRWQAIKNPLVHLATAFSNVAGMSFLLVRKILLNFYVRFSLHFDNIFLMVTIIMEAFKGNGGRTNTISV
jgi:hypothetical protein